MLLMGVCYHLATHAKFYTTRSGTQISRIEHEWFGYGDAFALAKEVGLYLKAMTEQDDTIFVWMQSPQINFYALRRTPSRAPIMSLPWPGLDEAVLQDVQRERPSYIVIFDGHPLPEGKLSAIVFGDYRKIINLPDPAFGSSQGAYGIYRPKTQVLR
jgi:hypothetical protein